MHINPHTKISTLIKANKACIDAIAALAKPFQKLKNPILRKLMASRVTIAEAAAMGGVSLEDFRRILEPLGFFWYLGGSDIPQSAEAPGWYTARKDAATDFFDVRPILENGDDPLKIILQRYDRLPAGHTLCIINSFIPSPLLRLLQKRGAQYYVDSKSDALHYTWFFKKTENSAQTKIAHPHLHMMDIASFECVLAKYRADLIVVLDVRDLPMPQPMELILDALTALQQEEILQIYHRRLPLHLLEELEDATCTIRICEYGKEDIRLLIFYDTP